MIEIANVPRIDSKRLLPVIAGVYTSQSVFSAVIFMALPSILRDSDTDLDSIGLLYLLMLPWALKVFWSPMVERYRLNVHAQSRSRKMILIGQALLVFCLFVSIYIDPSESFMVLVYFLAIATVIAATVDIVCDGFAIEQLKSTHRSWGNVMQVGGGYVGMMMGAGLFLVILDSYSWKIAMMFIVIMVVLLTMPAMLIQEPKRISTKKNLDALLRPALLNALKRPQILWSILIVILFQFGLRIILSTLPPFLVDQAFSLTLIGLVSGLMGTVVSLVGVILAGMLINAFGVKNVLTKLIVAQLLIYVCFFLVSLSSNISETLLIVLLVSNSLVIGASFVALYTAMMNWSSLSQAGVDFSLFQSIDATLLVLLGFVSNLVSHHFGYTATFASATFVVFVAGIFIPKLLSRTGDSRTANASSI
ncbi:MAG: MFS transporter [Arenicella sp.]